MYNWSKLLQPTKEEEGKEVTFKVFINASILRRNINIRKTAKRDKDYYGQPSSNVIISLSKRRTRWNLTVHDINYAPLKILSQKEIKDLALFLEEEHRLQKSQEISEEQQKLEDLLGMTAQEILDNA